MFRDAKLLIGGEAVDTGAHDEIRNPYSGEVVGTVAVGGADELERAIGAAVEAFEAARRLSAFRKRAMLRRIAVLTAPVIPILGHKPIATVSEMEIGKLRSISVCCGR